MTKKGGFFIVIMLREQQIDVYYETDLHANLSSDKLNTSVDQVLSLILRALGGRKTTAQSAGKAKI